MESLRIFKRALFFKGYRRYPGNAEEICNQIVKECWNGRFFQASTGHFNQFYTRDFGICIEGLLKSGYKEEIKMTLKYALDIFKKHNKITTTITPKGKAIDVFSYTPESIAMVIRCLRVLDDKELIVKYDDLINKEVNKAFSVFDTKIGLLNNEKFSSMKDNALRESSCYNNCMIAMLSKDLDKLKLNNPFKQHDIKNNIKREFWNGRYFYDDTRKKEYVAGDANVFPFWTGVFDDKQMFNSCLQEIKKSNLDKPWPLRYTSFKTKQRFANNLLVPNYEGTTIWGQLGLCFLRVVKKYDKKEFNNYLKKITDVIEKNRNLIEVFDPDGTPYKSLFYRADEGVIWGAMYLELL